MGFDGVFYIIVFDPKNEEKQENDGKENEVESESAVIHEGTEYGKMSGVSARRRYLYK